MFSFNSAVGACETCRGFGRVIGVDLGLVIPNDKLTLRAGAIKTIQTPAWKEAQDDLMRHAEAAGIPRDTPWYKLTPEQRAELEQLMQEAFADDLDLQAQMSQLGDSLRGARPDLFGQRAELRLDRRHFPAI